MRNTFSVLFYPKKGSEKKNGAAPIMARISVNAARSHFSTKLEIHPENWNIAAGKAKGKDAALINERLSEIRAVLHKIYHEQQQRQSRVTAENVKNEFMGLSMKHETILELFQKHNETVKEQVGISKTKPTYQKYEITRKHLADFIKSKYNLSDIAIKEINLMFITDFEVYLRTTCKCNANTTAKFMQFFKRIVIIALRNGILTIDPFLNYKIRIKTVDRGFLTEAEVVTILKKKMVSERLEHVKDLFLFACLTGLSYIDLVNLRADEIRENFDGELWIMTKRQKTGVKVNVPLLEIPKMILNKYRDKLPNGRILPVMSNQKLNAYLKEIADVCGIPKKLTFHMARHTFATTFTTSKGIPLETVSRMLGHTNLRTTAIYARVTDDKVGNDMQGLAAKLGKIEKLYEYA